MRDAVLLELADRWEREVNKASEMPEDGSDSAKFMNAKAHGYRECKRECVDTIRTLVSILGDSRL